MENKKYNLFPMSCIFDITSTKSGIDSINLNRVGEPKYPYVSRSAENNGVQCFVPEQEKKYKREDGNTISVGLDTQTVNYQPFPYYTSQNIQIFSNPNMDKYSALYVIPFIKEQLANLNWGGNGATLGRLSNKKILLPVDEDEKPDWNYMHEYAYNLCSKMKNIVKQQYHSEKLDNRNLEDVNYGVFTIEQVFGKLVAGKSKGLNHLQKGGAIPYVCASKKNNGVSTFVNPKTDQEKKMIQHGKCIAFIRNGVGSVGYSVYKEGDFIATSDVSLGYNEHLNRYTGLFITTVTDQIRGKYSHGYKRIPERLKREQLLLPVKDNGEIDWQFMEDYMKRQENILIDKAIK